MCVDRLGVTKGTVTEFDGDSASWYAWQHIDARVHYLGTFLENNSEMFTGFGHGKNSVAVVVARLDAAVSNVCIDCASTILSKQI